MIILKIIYATALALTNAPAYVNVHPELSCHQLVTVERDGYAILNCSSIVGVDYEALGFNGRRYTYTTTLQSTLLRVRW